MASPEHRSADILPWPIDHERRPRYVTPTLYNTVEEQRRIAAVVAANRRDLRIMRWQARIQWSCIAIAVATVFYFIFQAGRGL